MAALLTPIEPVGKGTAHDTLSSIELFQPAAHGSLMLGMTADEAMNHGFLLAAGQVLHMTLKPYEVLYCYSAGGYVPNYLAHVSEVSRSS